MVIDLRTKPVPIFIGRLTIFDFRTSLRIKL